MIIAINATYLNNKKNKEYITFLTVFFQQIINTYNSFTFIFITTNNAALEINSINNNCKLININSVDTKLKSWYFTHITINKLVKKYNIDVLIQLHGKPAKTKTKQILFFENEYAIPQKLQLNKYIISTIICFSNYVKNKTVETLKIQSELVIEIEPAIETNVILTTNELHQIKDGYADGREYFIYINNDTERSNVFNVLKAFSLFKKWQKSNMKLLVVDAWIINNPLFAEKLETYKYKDDVVLLNNITTLILTKIITASYCTIYLPLQDEIATTLLQLLQLKCAAICSKISFIEDYANNQVLYTDAEDVDTLANTMQLIYKDENIKYTLVKNIQNICINSNAKKFEQAIYN